eukprot:sb/3475423/
MHSKELIGTQRVLLVAQEELLKIQCRGRDVLLTEVATALAPKKIQSGFVAASDDRGCNIIIYGLEELNDKSGELETQIKSLFAELEEAPVVKSLERLGKQSQSARPVKVVLRNRESILSKNPSLEGR